MAVYKVLARCTKTNKQKIKKIYENDLKFNTYGKTTARRYQQYFNVEVYKMEEDEYILIYTLKMPETIEEFKNYFKNEVMPEKWVEIRLKELSNNKQS